MRKLWLCLSLLAVVGCRSSESAQPHPTVAPSAVDAAAPTVESAPAPSADASNSVDAATPAPTPGGEVDRVERDAVARSLEDMRRGHEAYYGVYIMGHKAGHGRIAYRASAAGEPGAPGGVVSEFQMEMAVVGGGNSNTIRIAERRFYGGEWPHALIASRFEQNAKGFVEVRDGKQLADGMHITRAIDGKAEPERVVGASAETLVDALRAAPLELAGIAYGKSVRAMTWDWEREADERLTVTPQREETRRRAGVDEKVAVIAIRYETTGVDATTIVGGSGEVLEMALGAAITMKLEEKDVALSGVSGLDVLGSGMKSPKAIGSPDTAERVVFELETTGDPKLPSSAAQLVEPTGPKRLRVTRVRGPGDAVTPEDAKAALAADATMDVEHPSIKAQAAALTTAEMKPAERVRAIAGFVYRTLDKKLATHLPTASRVLEAKVGDCTEHTWLTTALLRAAGVPARPIYGVAYTGDGEKTFAYHAWVEVELDGRWVWIDPTWGEDVADATHLALGSDLGAVAPSLGAITIIDVTR